MLRFVLPNGRLVLLHNNFFQKESLFRFKTGKVFFDQKHFRIFRFDFFSFRQLDLLEIITIQFELQCLVQQKV